MKRFALCLIAFPACAEPIFVDEAASLPHPQIYAGGWEHFVGGGVAVLDCNGDAKPDLFAAGGENPAALFVNRSEVDGAFHFTSGEVEPFLGVTGAYPLDIDSDGVMDLAVLRAGPNQLWRGLGDCRFEEATEAWGLPTRDDWTTSFTATWEKGQSLPTLFFGNYVDRTNPDGPFEACDSNALLRPNGMSYAEIEPISPGYCALSALITDWQRVGEPELRISNDRHYYVRGGYEQMFRLNPLQERQDWPHVSLWGMGIASRDLTGDGLPEVMMTSMGDQLLQINRGDHFENAPYARGTYAQRPFVGDDGRPSTGWHPAFGDVDNDGLVDLFISKGNVDQMPSNATHDPNNLLMQAPDGTFHEVADLAGIATTHRSRGAALVDLNADGLLDLVVMNRRAPMELWRNATQNTGHWAEIEPIQAGTNPQAVGAWVELRVGDKVEAQEVTVGGGHAGGMAGPLHFGLGSATQAKVRVIWPDGAVGAWQPVTLDARQQLTR
ncbi:VCBS repeat protein [Rhodobacter sp. JA431]|uniref:CRTAC1 family protein n=1 Tax=Rhodobacter sp. JA431 TaxID=570013 RepID=UPI000BC9B9AA|nr:CRTAC1 family protein [Rhodobacter sp. JA431]SOC07974.1 VCBS repeat protein [Rhodobacter sp. JA431]